MFQPEKAGGRHIELFATDPETGRQIRWQLDEQPRTIKEISQIVVLDANDEVVADIAIPTAITTGSELLKLLNEHGIRFIEKAQVIAASGDYARIERLFSEIGKEVRLQPGQAVSFLGRASSGSRPISATFGLLPRLGFTMR